MGKEKKPVHSAFRQEVQCIGILIYMSKHGGKTENLHAAVFFIIFLACGLLVAVTLYQPRVKEGKEAIKEVLPIPKIEEEVKAPDLLGRAQISFAGGTEERNKNIEIGISRLSGTVISPGEEFSFTDVLGPVTEEEGYSEAKVFLNGEVVKGLGGGLCQVSTTLFRSALAAGLPISERHNHTYTVSYYDVGLDATYSDPGPDLKFINDTGKPIIIKGEVKDQYAIFEIYGTSDGRIASTTEPEITSIVDVPPPLYVATTTRLKKDPDCINSPQIGYTAKIIYGVEYPGGVWKGKDFTSTYRPLQRICYFTATTTVAKN